MLDQAQNGDAGAAERIVTDKERLTFHRSKAKERARERLGRLQSRIASHRDEDDNVAYPTTEPHPGKIHGQPPTEGPGVLGALQRFYRRQP